MRRSTTCWPVKRLWSARIRRSSMTATSKPFRFPPTSTPAHVAARQSMPPPQYRPYPGRMQDLTGRGCPQRGTAPRPSATTARPRAGSVSSELWFHEIADGPAGGMRERATGHRPVRCTRLMTVTQIRPAADAGAAQWLLRSDVDWWDLVRYGPPGFDVYVRIAFPHDSEGDACDPSGGAPVDPVRAALATLGSYTTTPSQGYAAIWEGWTGGAPPAPQAPRVEIPNRAMLVFTGPVEALRDAPALAWYGSAAGVGQGPHLVWPEDQAWCLACEVDEEIEFTVGCSEEVSQALARALPGAVRRVRYGQPAPMYRDPA